MTTSSDPQAMSPDELRALLEQIGLSQAGFAALVRVDRGTPNHWLAGRVEVPRWAAAHLRALVAVQALCAMLPVAELQPLPPRLRGLAPIEEKLHRRNLLREEGIALFQQTHTMDGMDADNAMAADAFKDALRVLGWSQVHFAEAVGVTVGTASRWANGAPIPAWVPVHLGLLLEIRRLHSTFVRPD